MTPSPDWRALRQELLRFVRARVRGEDDADEIVQHVLERTHATLPSLRDPGRLRAFLLQVARNTIIDRARARRPSEEITDDLAAPVPDEELAEIATCLTPLLASVPEPYRDAVRAFDLEGLSHKEIAAKLGLTVSGAKTRVMRGRAHLREALLSCCTFEHAASGLPVSFLVKNEPLVKLRRGGR